MEQIPIQESFWATESSISSDYISRVLKVAQLDAFRDKSEVWQIIATSQKLRYLTHGFFRYYGKFPPPIARKLMELYGKPGGVVLDPMVGSGTSLVEALVAGYKSIGCDVNPLSVLMSKVKVTPVNLSRLNDNFKMVKEQYTKKRRNPSQKMIDGIPIIRNINHWFFQETCEDLAVLKHLIMTNIDDSITRDFLSVTFAGIIRRSSRASNGMGRIFFDGGKEPPDVFALFEKQYNSMFKTMQQCNDYLRARGEEFPVSVHEVDARKIDFIDDNEIELIVTHPPYFNLYKYSRVFSFELHWLGFDYKGIRDKEIREAFKVGKPEKVDDYVEDMADVLKEYYRILKPNSYLGLMIGDTLIRDERICTTSKTIVRAEELGFRVKKLYLRIPKFTEATYATAQRRTKKDLGVALNDFVVVLKK